MDQRIQNIKITEGVATPSWTHTLEVQDYGVNIDPEFYTGSAYDEAISGFLRQNFRGVRPKITLDWGKSVQQSEMRSLVNDIITSFSTNGDDYVYFYPDASKSDYFKVILDSGSYSYKYTNQIGRFSPSITLVSVYIFNSDNPDGNTNIPSYLQAP